MKRLFSILVALALVLSFGVVTTPVAADVTPATVTPDPNAAGAAAKYTVVFDTTAMLVAGQDYVYIEFPEGTGIADAEDLVITVEGVAPEHVEVVGDQVNMRVHQEIAAGEVTVVFEEGITNPDPGLDYTLDVSTSRTADSIPVASEEYKIIAAQSTYKFVVDFDKQYKGIVAEFIPPVEVGDNVSFELTLATDLPGAVGYDEVLIKFELVDAPSATAEVRLTLDVYQYELTLDDPEGYYGPEDGFQLAAEYKSTTLCDVEFNEVGDYDFYFWLKDLEAEEGEEVITEAFATVSVKEVVEAFEMELDAGWNLVSLPFMPLYADIETQLAALEAAPASVHHYDAAADDWFVYSPPVQDFTTMEDGKAYWIKMAAAAPLWVFGMQLDPEEVPPAYDVVTGWNMVGFKSMDDMAATLYLDGTDFVRIYGYDEDGWFPISGPDFDQPVMKPGLGYWVAFSAPGTIFP